MLMVSRAIYTPRDFEVSLSFKTLKYVDFVLLKSRGDGSTEIHFRISLFEEAQAAC